ncbi:MAG TPA: DUF3885 domain-containing protein [Oligoflexus sp.]|uniref:DUF3885 domain-containing protein n=1 Tax=Oligoflexus sp. TaxID=1971216 RepID=UPI002D432447|nr:DUF3885 domain-containing protein [Oligoflexus sp.]HYX33657.1 DUF3885 domain-containing protein [Oligoflexus sp.]
MSIKNQVESIFGLNVFDHPLFYRYQGGLRLELSQGGTHLNQFLTAVARAKVVCDYVFQNESDITICLQSHATNLADLLRSMRQLREAGIVMPSDREHWLSPEPDDEELIRRMLVFSLPKDFISNVLWCACSSDFAIRPRPGFSCYLLNLDLGIAILPYDDRGMDIVGPNHTYLKSLYNKFQDFLLDYDRDVMDQTFRKQT